MDRFAWVTPDIPVSSLAVVGGVSSAVRATYRPNSADNAPEYTIKQHVTQWPSDLSEMPYRARVMTGNATV